MKKLNNYAITIIGLVIVGFAVIMWYATLPDELTTPQVEIPNITQKVTLVSDYDKFVLESHWLQDNEEALRNDIMKLKDNPYSEGKTVYRLKTSLGNENDSFVYGSQTYIEGKRCEEYNKMIDIRKGLVQLNKPINCISK